jgi:hypothetical protein
LRLFLVGFEVITAVVMKSYIFWDIMLCSLLLAICFMLGLFFDPEDGGDMFLQNVC